MKKTDCVRTPKRMGEKTIALINKLGLNDRNLEIQRDKEFIYIPVVRPLSAEELKTLKQQVTDCEIATHIFPERKKTGISFVRLLEDKFPSHFLASLPRAIDFVGDIAIIEIPSELDRYKPVIGKAVLETNPKVHTVLAKAGAISGMYRLRNFAVVAGEPKTETIHKEYGSRYYVDLARTYFSPRLSSEHHRVASLTKEGETVVDLFAGAGPFSVSIAKNHHEITVYAVDVNPGAIECLKKNIRINRLIGKVHPILGDARQVVQSRLSGVADRAIMNLPEKAIEFLETACKTIKSSGGTLHFYSFVNKTHSLESLKVRFARAVEESDRSLEKILFSRLVRETAPHEWQAVLDARIL